MMNALGLTARPHVSKEKGGRLGPVDSIVHDWLSSEVVGSSSLLRKGVHPASAKGRLEQHREL